MCNDTACIDDNAEITILAEDYARLIKNNAELGLQAVEVMGERDELKRERDRLLDEVIELKQQIAEMAAGEDY